MTAYRDRLNAGEYAPPEQRNRRTRSRSSEAEPEQPGTPQPGTPQPEPTDDDE